MKKITILITVIMLFALTIPTKAQTEEQNRLSLVSESQRISHYVENNTFHELIEPASISAGAIAVYIFVANQGYVFIADYWPAINDFVNRSAAFPVPLTEKIRGVMSFASAVSGVVKANLSSSGDLVARYNSSGCVWQGPNIGGHWICPMRAKNQ